VPDEIYGRTPLQWAARSSHAQVSTLEHLIALGANVNARSVRFELTALTDAAEGGSPAKVSCLLDHGADPSYRNESGYTALILGAPPLLETTRILLERGGETRRGFLF
jgi:ankyrin repeat protein